MSQGVDTHSSTVVTSKDDRHKDHIYSGEESWLHGREEYNMFVNVLVVESIKDYKVYVRKCIQFHFSVFIKLASVF